MRNRSKRDIDADVDTKPPHRLMFRDGVFALRRLRLKILGESHELTIENWCDRYIERKALASLDPTLRCLRFSWQFVTGGNLTELAESKMFSVLGQRDWTKGRRKRLQSIRTGVWVWKTNDISLCVSSLNPTVRQPFLKGRLI